MKAAGFKIVYDHGVGPFDTNFLPDIIAMKNKGVKMFFSTELPDNYAATLAKQFQQQNFKAINIEGRPTRANCSSWRARRPTTCTSSRAYALYLGQDAKTGAGRSAFRHMDEEGRLQPQLRDRVRLRLDVGRALRPGAQSGRQPAHAVGLIAALNKVTFFNAGGLVPPSNPAQAIPSGCFLLAQVQNGRSSGSHRRLRPGSTAGRGAS